MKLAVAFSLINDVCEGRPLSLWREDFYSNGNFLFAAALLLLHLSCSRCAFHGQNGTGEIDKAALFVPVVRIEVEWFGVL